GRDPDVAPRLRRRSRAQGPRRRAVGARARGALAPRGPHPRLRQQDRGLRVTTNFRAGVLLGLAVLVAAMWLSSIASKRLQLVASGSAALEPRRFEAPTYVAVGTGGTFENHLRLGPGAAVGLEDRVVLVDAGRGIAQALRRAQIPVEQPVVLLTSLSPESTL